ncbi:Protein of unknown function [Natronorubrum sediminis]|uniref:Uncharacterized protein n=1 Tax=Natronorubrum sediminis TaxID=640943 RepID=A0A1H6G4U2_9EURY|nr:Protein of unknown function [Natronorubrum sediminis]
MKKYRLRLYSVVGLILLALGVIMVFYGHQGIVEYESMSGEFARTFSGDHQDQYERYWWTRTIGVIIAIVGGIDLLSTVQDSE